MQIQIQGQEKLQDYFKKIIKKSRPALKEVITEACSLLTRKMKINAPRDTRLLSSRINLKIYDKIEGISGEVGTDIEYARPLEFLNYKRRHGSRIGQSTKFMRPTFEENFNKIVNMFSNKLKEVLT